MRFGYEKEFIKRKKFVKLIQLTIFWVIWKIKIIGFLRGSNETYIKLRKDGFIILHL